jgi:hypothetical protein
MLGMKKIRRIPADTNIVCLGFIFSLYFVKFFGDNVVNHRMNVKKNKIK